MTWSVWRVSPFVTSIFFVLGVITLYWLLYNWILNWVHGRHYKVTDETVNTWFGVLYMLAFVFGMQYQIVGQHTSWEYMNFQIIGVIFCAYFLNVRLSNYLLAPIMLIYMFYNHSIVYWQSWAHAITLFLFFGIMSYIRIHYQDHHLAPLLYMAVGVPFGGLLWFWMKLKFTLPWGTFWQEWIYLIIFEVLLYVYVRVLTDNTQIKAQLVKFAHHDALTQTENFAAYSEEITQLFKSNSKENLQLSMMMFDIDHFKSVNDTYGHLAGDKVLQQVTSEVQTVINANNPHIRLYRTGGEEFNIIFPGYDLPSTQVVVDQIFNAVNHLPITFDKKVISITISVGVSEVESTDVTHNDFYNRVDKNLYHSKRNGRMQITVG